MTRSPRSQRAVWIGHLQQMRGAAGESAHGPGLWAWGQKCLQLAGAAGVPWVMPPRLGDRPMSVPPLLMPPPMGCFLWGQPVLGPPTSGPCVVPPPFAVQVLVWEPLPCDCGRGAWAESQARGVRWPARSQTEARTWRPSLTLSALGRQGLRGLGPDLTVLLPAPPPRAHSVPSHQSQVACWAQVAHVGFCADSGLISSPVSPGAGGRGPSGELAGLCGGQPLSGLRDQGAARPGQAGSGAPAAAHAHCSSPAGRRARGWSDWGQDCRGQVSAEGRLRQLCDWP